MAAADNDGTEDCFIPNYFKENVPSCPECGKVGGMFEGNPYINDHEEWCIYSQKLPCKSSVYTNKPKQGGARRRARRKSRKSRKNRRSSRKNRKSRRSTRRK